MPKGQYTRARRAEENAPLRTNISLGSQPVEKMTTVDPADPDPIEEPLPSLDQDGDGWLPIETAPRNKTVIWIKAAESQYGVKAYWRATRERIGLRWVPRDGWVEPMFSRPLRGEFTHWKPL